MAKIINKEYATFDAEIWGSKSSVPVGHNRMLRRVKEPWGVCLHYSLHGHDIATLCRHTGGRLTLTLDHCGYMTRTTQSAMKDAIKLFGFWGNVSFARGVFSYGVERKYEGNPLEFHEARHNWVYIPIGE